MGGPLEMSLESQGLGLEITRVGLPGGAWMPRLKAFKVGMLTLSPPNPDKSVV